MNDSQFSLYELHHNIVVSFDIKGGNISKSFIGFRLCLVPYIIIHICIINGQNIQALLK